MADVYDKASDVEEYFRSKAIDDVRRRNNSLKKTGHCLCCNAQIDNNGLFCGVECREDYELEQRIRAITGR